MALWKCFAVGSLLPWYKSHNLKYIFCILNHKRNEKKKQNKNTNKKNMTMKVFFSSVWKIRFSVNIVNAVSKEKTWLKQRYVSVKFKIIGIKVVKKTVAEM